MFGKKSREESCGAVGGVNKKNEDDLEQRCSKKGSQQQSGCSLAKLQVVHAVVVSRAGSAKNEKNSKTRPPAVAMTKIW